MADDDEERRHLSPDSSTQALHREKRSHRKKKHKHKSKKRKRKHSDEDEGNSNDERKSVSSNDSNASSGGHEQQHGKNQDDLVLDIKPLTEYVDDRKELNNELFKIFGRKEMKKLLPKSIKKMDVDELKSRCLDQLEVLSKKRLLKIIEGREMSGSSSESEHEVSKSEADAKDSCKQNSSTQLKHPEAHETQHQSVNILEELSLIPDQHEIDELVEGTTTTEATVETTEESHKEFVVDTESQLLELEYRARALKSMVKAQQRLNR